MSECANGGKGEGGGAVIGIADLPDGALCIENPLSEVSPPVGESGESNPQSSAVEMVVNSSSHQPLNEFPPAQSSLDVQLPMECCTDGNLKALHSVDLDDLQSRSMEECQHHNSASCSHEGSSVEQQGLVRQEDIAWIRNRRHSVSPQEQKFFSPQVAVASKLENFRWDSTFWRLMDHIMAFFFLLFLMFLMTLLLTMQITFFFIMFARKQGPVTFFFQLTTLALPIVCASLSNTVCKLMLSTAAGYEFMELRLFLHLHLVKVKGRETLVQTEAGWKPLHNSSIRLKWFIQVFHSSVTMSLLLLPFVAGAAVGIVTCSISFGLQWLFTFSIMAAAVVSFIMYFFNLFSYAFQIRNALRELIQLRPKRARPWHTVVEYLNASNQELMEYGLKPKYCRLFSLDVLIDDVYGIYHKVKVAHTDAVSAWITYRTPEFGSVWFLQILCMLLSTVLSGIALAEDVPPSQKTPLDTLSLNALLLPAAGLKLAATVLAILARPMTIRFLKEHRIRAYPTDTAAAPVRGPPSKCAQLTVCILAFLSFGISLVLLWVLCSESQYPFWLGALFMPGVLLGDLWALLPLVFPNKCEMKWCAGAYAKCMEFFWRRLVPHRLCMMWATTGIVVAICLTYFALGIQAAVVAGFQFYVVVGLLVCFTTLSGALILRRRLHVTTTYWCFLFFYYIFALAILVSLETAALQVPEVSEFIPNGPPISMATRHYPICNTIWKPKKASPKGESYGALNIVDIVLMNQLTALPNLTVALQQLPVWFPNGWELVFRSSAPPGQPRFDHFFNPYLEMSVVVVRGTKTIGDIVQDLYFWAPAGILQIFSILVPLLQLLPISVIRWLIVMASFEDWMNSFGQGLAFGYQYPVLEYVKANCSGHQTIVTGHSMGGAVAGVVGISLNLSIVSISGPGISYSIRKFRLPEDQDALQRTDIVTIIPDNDIVPRIDKQLGLVQNIACHSHLGYCHDLPSTICELLRTCGDPSGRLVRSKASVPCLSNDY